MLAYRGINKRSCPPPMVKDLGYKLKGLDYLKDPKVEPPYNLLGSQGNVAVGVIMAGGSFFGCLRGLGIALHMHMRLALFFLVECARVCVCVCACVCVYIYMFM